MRSREREAGVFHVSRISSNKNAKESGLDHPAHLRVVEREIVRTEVEANHTRLTRSKRNPTEPAQLHHWPRDRSHFVTDIELNYLFTRSSARICQRELDPDRITR